MYVIGLTRVTGLRANNIIVIILLHMPATLRESKSYFSGPRDRFFKIKSTLYRFLYPGHVYAKFYDYQLSSLRVKK